METNSHYNVRQRTNDVCLRSYILGSRYDAAAKVMVMVVVVVVAVSCGWCSFWKSRE